MLGRARPTDTRQSPAGVATFSAPDRSSEIIQPAIWRHDNAVSRHMRQRTANTRRHRLWRLDSHVRQIERTEDDGLAQQFLQY